MKRPPNVHRGTTSRDLADHGVGYSASGESEFSRRAASVPNVKMPSYAVSKPKLRGPLSRPEVIAENERELLKLRDRIRLATDPAKLAKLKKNLNIKMSFVEKLRAELG
ncbi:hypothetical protein [Bradyrhizobium sp. Ash2021]|uniref:hypothetical protein n=1 Tax=Bradyrhizobium sp. Ash2021 TaxID=2954771 RepID=UPI002815D477|nr:hypothetical protein [Bradyrhizobium sp. Ash2021]WMT75069.1 hypothetical protein NL528_01095 [Bradyrhizobium sp. Ash2021]